MAFKKIDYKGNGFFILLILSYTWFMFRGIFMNLKNSLYTAVGDGMKNYYTFLYHSLYGNGTVFNGMNYPFTEHVSFTDNQPFLAIPLSFFREYFHLNMNDFLIIMNIFIPLGFIISGYFLFRFLLKLNINAYLSAVFALIITAMSPNLFRTFGHFGLCYTFFITGTLLYIFEYYYTKKNKFLVYLFLVNIFIPFLHIYNLAISFFLVICISLAKIIIDKTSIKKKLKSVFPPFLILFFVFFIFKLFVFFTDKINDRPKNPWGIINYVTHGEQLFTSKISQLGSAFNLLFDINIGADFGEGYAYIGFLATLFCLYCFLYLLFNLLFKKLNNNSIQISESQKIIILGGLLALLFSMGVPFVWNMEFLIDYIPAIKQFRSLGRFSIIFYYCISIAMIVSIDSYLKQLFEEKKYIQYTFSVFIFLGIPSIEIFSYGNEFQTQCDKGKDNYALFFDKVNKIKNDANLQKLYSTYQAFITIPFFCIGSEKVGVDGWGHIIDESFKFSLASKLPMFNTHLSRSSWSQTFALMRMLGGKLTDKKLISDKLNNKPILLFVESKATLTLGEQYLVDQSKFVGNYESWNLFSLNWQEMIKNETAFKDSVKKISNDNFNILLPEVIANHYDNENSSISFYGKSAKNVSSLDSFEIYKGLLPFKKDSIVEFSIWSLVNNYDYKMPSYTLFIYDNADTVVKRYYLSSKESYDNVGFWFRTNCSFTMQENYKSIKIELINTNHNSTSFIDEFLLKPANINTLYKEKEKILYNNHLIH